MRMADYPSTRQLRTIRNWTGTFRELWDYVVGLWHWDGLGAVVKPGIDTDELELHTYGWSGNEQLVYVLEHGKSLFFAMFHTKWERGGHYYFKVRHEMWDINLSAQKVDK
jgi:hypothetical protein